MANKLDIYQICLPKRSGTLKNVIIKKNKITDSSITKAKIFNPKIRKQSQWQSQLQ